MMERPWYLTISPSWHGLLGIQAAYLVKRFEEGKSHHQTKAQLLDARRVIAQKEAEIEKLKSQVSLKVVCFERHRPAQLTFLSPTCLTHSIVQVLALETSIQQAHDSLGEVPSSQPKAPGA